MNEREMKDFDDQLEETIMDDSLISLPDERNKDEEVPIYIDETSVRETFRQGHRMDFKDVTGYKMHTNTNNLSYYDCLNATTHKSNTKQIW